jgi:hypothetical protein
MIRENRFMIKIIKILTDTRKKERLYRRTTNPEENNRGPIEFLIKLL